MSESAVSRLGFSSLAGENSQESALTAPEKESHTDGANPSVASLGFWVCNVPLWQHQSSALWACSIPLGNTRPREHDANPNPRFLCRGLLTLWRKMATNCSYCARRARDSKLFLLDERRNSPANLRK